jgi:hypothetical protein
MTATKSSVVCPPATTRVSTIALAGLFALSALQQPFLPASEARASPQQTIWDRQKNSRNSSPLSHSLERQVRLDGPHWKNRGHTAIPACLGFSRRHGPR